MAIATDLEVSAAGLALRIDRRYDSLESGTSGDFGYGWSLGVNVDLQVDPVGNVTFTLGGRRRTFYLTPVPVFGGPFSGIGVYKPAFTGEPGFTGSLTASLDGCLIIDILLPMGNNWICASQTLYSPQIYTYTDPNGTVYTIASTGALQSVQDLSGNLLTITAAGISSSNGLTVPFVRDGQGRITQITDTMGNQYLYGYDTPGNLVSVTYPGIATPAVFVYDGGHVLIQEKDRRGNVVGISTYDGAGRLQTITDGVGNKTQYAYDTSTNTTTVTNADGGTIVTVANAAGDPVSVTDPLGRTTAYTYDGNRNVLTKTDPMGKVWTYTYDARGFKTSEKDPLGNASLTVYNQYGGPVTMTDALGNVKTVSYDATFRPVTITDSIGQIAGATYNAAGSIAGLKDANGNSSQMTYDTQGNTIGVTDALARTAGATYDALGERLTLTDSLANDTTYSYDAAGRLLATTLADGSSSSVTYDGNGNVATRVDALGRTTTYTYDAEDHVIQTTYADGTSTSATYNWRGQALTQTDQAGHVTKYEYDLAGQLLKTTVAYGTADAATTLSSYDVAGRRTTSTDARGTVTTSTFDDAGRLIGITDALHHSSTFTYDAAGRQVTVTDPLGRTTQTAYDARGRVTQVTYPDGTTTSSTYDGVGQVIALTDQAGQVTHYAFDAGGQMLSVTDALNQATNYAYDANGNRLSRTDANNHTATYTYDVVNRMKTRTLPGGGNAESFSYNLTGTTASVMDFNGKTTTFGYDKLDRLLMRTPDVSFGEAAVSFTYTSSGRRLTMTDGSGTTSYGYDNQDRLVSKTNGAGTLTYTYDTAGNRLTMVSSNANGTNAGYSYDELNRLKTVTDNGAGATTTYSYDVAGNLSGTTLPNGVQIAPQLDAMNRVTGLPVTSKPAANYNYTYGLVGNRLVASDSNGSSHYTYNSVYRLTEEAVSRPQLAGTLNYGLDPVGNRLSLLSTLAGIGSQTASYDANDRVTTNSYDNNGNTLTAGSRTFRYDSMDRMTNFNSGAATMVYDGDGNRVSKTSGGAATVYLVDEGNPTGLSQVVEEIVGGVVKRRYTYGQGRISQTQAGVTSYYGYDGHGDVRFLMDGTGTVTDTYDYDAWGNLVASTGTTPNVYRYQGEALDSETGLYYLRARYYDPLSGRFLSVDPMADEGEHPYTYAGADPVNGRDPTGTQDILEYRWLSPGPVTFIAVALLFSVEDLEAQGGSPGTPTGRMPPGPTPGGPPKKKCCEGALRDEVNRFLHRQAPSFINWEPNMAGLAVAAGKLDNVDPRLLVAIPALEGGNGKHFGHNNPFGLMDKKVLRHFSSPADAIQADADNLALHIYAQHQSTVALLYAGNTWVYKGARHWPQYVIDFPAYCVGWNPATQKMDPAFTKACQVAGRKIAGFLSSMTGDKESNLRPGNPNDLSYPCPR